MSDIPDAPHLPQLEQVPVRPVFILGEPRSGTTLLYKLLGLSGCFNIVTVYHLMRYDELMKRRIEGTEAAGRHELDDHIRSLGLHTRKIDDMPLDSGMPEEYCFFLDNRSRNLRVVPANLDLFLEFCRKVQFAGDPTRTLLLKNPWDVRNFLYLHSVLPEARFVFIDRHPLEILSSQIKALRKSWREGNPYFQMIWERARRLNKKPWFLPLVRWAAKPDSVLQPVLRLLIRGSKKSRDFYRQHIGEVPADLWTTVRYDDLCNDAQGCIEHILGRLGLKPAVEVDYREWIKRRPRELEPDVQRAAGRLCRKLACKMDEGAY